MVISEWDGKMLYFNFLFLACHVAYPLFHPFLTSSLQKLFWLDRIGKLSVLTN